MMAGILDRVRKAASRVGPAGAVTDALQGATKKAEDARYNADEKKYGPRIAREEALKRAKKK